MSYTLLLCWKCKAEPKEPCRDKGVERTIPHAGRAIEVQPEGESVPVPRDWNEAKEFLARNPSTEEMLEKLIQMANKLNEGLKKILQDARKN